MDGANERRERKDAQRNMERVLRAAHALFAERGADVTMEEVARRAGVGVGTIYRRFPSKDHLFAAVSQTVCADTRHCLQAAAQAEHDPIDKIRALVFAQYQRCEEQAALLDPHQVAGQSRGAAFDREELYTTLHSLLRYAILEGQQAGVIREGDAAVLAALCLELLSPRAFQNLTRLVGGHAEGAVDQAVRFVLLGLGVR